MQYFIDFFDLLASIHNLLPGPILFGFSIFLVVGLLRVVIELL